MSDRLRWPWDQVDRLSDWIGPHLAARSAELTILALATIALMVLAQASLLLIMASQRPWTHLQRALFWFVASKELFWGYVLYAAVRTAVTDGLTGTYQARVVAMLSAMAVASAGMLYSIDRRYRRGIAD